MEIDQKKSLLDYAPVLLGLLFALCAFYKIHIKFYSGRKRRITFRDEEEPSLKQERKMTGGRKVSKNF